MEERHRYRSILLFGMPGSGKGTQGAVLGQLPSFIHISMGDVFRKIPRAGRFGREIEQYTSQGLLVPDDLTVRIFERHLNILEMQELVMPEQHTLVLDGLPRNPTQAERIAGFIDVLQIFHLKLYDTDKLVDRLQARALSENRLDDMNEEVIHRRLQAYHDETFKTLSLYPRELILEIDASQRAVRRALHHRRPARRDQAPLRSSGQGMGRVHRGRGRGRRPPRSPVMSCSTPDDGPR